MAIPSLLFALSSLAILGSTAPVTGTTTTTPTVAISSPEATFVGVSGDVEKFLGIPFASPPVGSLRLKPPQPLTASLGFYDATATGAACPQMVFNPDFSNIPTEVIQELATNPLLAPPTNQSEDCLNINVYRPTGVSSSSKLPVVFWIFGGGFESGWNSLYDGSLWVQESVSRGQPSIYVAVNYRIGGFGFLGGKEILADGAANLGLLDQRLGLKWVADNIEAFGGDPEKVTIWGESAGAMSVLDQMILYDGDINYNGKPLFRGAIMNSGSVVPTDPVDCPKAQAVYDTVVSAAGCSSANDTLACLREVDFQTLLDATNAIPSFLSYSSVALPYLPRPDGTVLTQSPDVLVGLGKYAAVPFIIGDQEDEGTLFSLFQSNITTEGEVVDYLSEYLFHGATKLQLEAWVATYPNTSDYGSPFGTDDSQNWYPQYKRLAAILGDVVFNLSRRALLELTSLLNPTVPSWTYLTTYDHGKPYLGTYHVNDLLMLFYGQGPSQAYSTMYSHFISFVNTLDPNDGANSTANWPEWVGLRQMLNISSTESTLTTDIYRTLPYTFMLTNINSLHV